MERLTIREEDTAAPNRETIGDICATLPVLCHDFECWECPMGRLIDRLCEYEDTGLTPEEIVELKEKKNTVAKVQRCKGDREHMTARVTRRGILIKGNYYYTEKLLLEYFGERVDVVIYNDLYKAEVYWRKQLIEEFELFICPGYRHTRTEIATAIEKMKQIKSLSENTSPYISRYGVNEAIAFLAEHHAFDMEDGQLFYHHDRVPENAVRVCNSKAKLIIRIKSFFEKMSADPSTNNR